MNCKDFREIADSYLSNELLVETNHEVLRHLENCADCRGELTARRNLREKLREAVKRAPQSRLNANFAARLTGELREKYEAPRTGWTFANPIKTKPVFAGILAILVLFVAIGLVWKFGRANEIANLNLPKPDRSNTIPVNENSSLQIEQAAFVEMKQDAIDDHKHCALKFSLEKEPISLDEAAETCGKFNKDLDKAVIAPLKEAFGAQVKFLEAHSCIINGRRFAHIVLKYQERVISVLVAKREDGAQIENGDAISCQSVENLRISCFQTANFGVFVISDLNEAENLKLARTISPAIKKHFEQS